ncbi:MAG: GTPase RsgA, partial [Planctomycetota bacterium]|nr:GTPase RsgA [Planctomycetota bacterium]
MAKKKTRKLRTQLKKGHQVRTRNADFTREYREHGFKEKGTVSRERLTGKGELTRHRTVFGEAVGENDDPVSVHLEVDVTDCVSGRVLSVHGLNCKVQGQDGREYRCAVRGLLKNLTTDQRNVVAAGDIVMVRRESSLNDRQSSEGLIVRIEPRYGCISRTSNGQQHVLVANVDQMVIVTSAAEPELKPNLIERFLVTAEKVGCTP